MPAPGKAPPGRRKDAAHHSSWIGATEAATVVGQNPNNFTTYAGDLLFQKKEMGQGRGNGQLLGKTKLAEEKIDTEPTTAVFVAPVVSKN